MKPIPSFNNLLEQYVFRMAEQVIDRADSQTQTRLIKLIHQIDSPTPTSDAVGSLAELALSEHLQALNTPGKLILVAQESLHQAVTTRIRRIHQQQRATLAQLARQLVQVRANLAQTQAKLEEHIGQNKILLARCRASAKL